MFLATRWYIAPLISRNGSQVYWILLQTPIENALLYKSLALQP